MKSERIKNFYTDLCDKKTLRIPLLTLLSAGFFLLQAAQLHNSLDVNGFFDLSFPVILLNCAILAWAALVMKLLIQRWFAVLYLSAILGTVWSIVGHFVLLYHGSPLFFSEFRNFGTAMNVVGGYSLSWSETVTGAVLRGAGLLLIATAAFFLRKRGERFFSLKRTGISAAALILCTVVLFLFMFVWEYPKPRKSMGWAWKKGVSEYGYVSEMIEDVDRSVNAYNKPEGYDPSHLDSLTAPNDPVPEEAPDLIFILNESFADLHSVIQFTSDVDPLESFYGLDNAIYGNAVITSCGGHTNNTEYELLTSNSMVLLNRPSPFTYVNLSGVPYTLPRYLKSLGYTCAALHCGGRSNYSRNRAYPEMGFDTVILGPENFTRGRYGNRVWLDSDNYSDMAKVYDSMGEGPRMIFLLTFQNHGGYESNYPGTDTVHLNEDFGDLTDDLNEYLTSLRMSAEAFSDLTKRFADSDRPVVICMLGDHLPSFIGELADRLPEDEAEKEIAERTVPYVIWANYGIEAPEYPDYATSTDLVPMTLKAAGLPLSAYYRKILDVRELFPARTIHGFCRTKDGKYGRTAEDPNYGELISLYELEYNGLAGGSDCREELFLP